MNAFSVDRLVLGPFAVNCYIVSCGQYCFLVDPGSDFEAINRVITSKRSELLFILNTHGHGDHIRCDSLFGVPVYIHKGDQEFLYDPNLNLSYFFGQPFIIDRQTEVRPLGDGHSIEFCDSAVKVIHTPGHTPGGVCFRLDDILFTGDTLFYNSIGRTDLPMADHNQLISSIKSRLFAVEQNCTVYPGHGNITSLAEEKAGNPFL